MQPLERPLLADQIEGQPIEQFRMGWTLAKLSKVIGRPHKSLAEMPPPEPIDEHSAGERVIRPREPLGEFQPAALIGAEGRFG